MPTTDFLSLATLAVAVLGGLFGAVKWYIGHCLRVMRHQIKIITHEKEVLVAQLKDLPTRVIQLEVEDLSGVVAGVAGDSGVVELGADAVVMETTGDSGVVDLGADVVVAD